MCRRRYNVSEALQGVGGVIMCRRRFSPNILTFDRDTTCAILCRSKQYGLYFRWRGKFVKPLSPLSVWVKSMSYLFIMKVFKAAIC